MKLTDMQKNIAAIIFLMGLGITVYKYGDNLVTNDAFAGHLKDHREKELLEVLYECETKYPNSKNEFIAKRCKDAEIEYKQLTEEEE